MEDKNLVSGFRKISLQRNHLIISQPQLMKLVKEPSRKIREYTQSPEDLMEYVEFMSKFPNYLLVT